MRNDHSGDGTRLSGVGRRYRVGGPWVLRGVDLDIAAGCLVRVEGANGSGKSTLLRLLAGLDAPSEGRISGRGRTAYVPERFPARLPFTAAGYLTRLGRVHGLPRAAAARAAREWLERFDAGALAGTPLSELSKGSSQKVAVAQALLARPELLVLDEAWTGLDLTARAELDRAVVERAAAGGAVVFVDHDPRRLVASVGARYAVTRGSVTRQATEDGGPMTLIEVLGPQDTPLPPPLVPNGTTRGGTLRLSVPAADSDAALRALLEAQPPWHVVSVSRAAPEGERHRGSHGKGASE